MSIGRDTIGPVGCPIASVCACEAIKCINHGVVVDYKCDNIKQTIPCAVLCVFLASTISHVAVGCGARRLEIYKYKIICLLFSFKCVLYYCSKEHTKRDAAAFYNALVILSQFHLCRRVKRETVAGRACGELN